MERSRSHLIVLGLVVAVLAAVFGIGYTHPIRLGLDLQGGLEVVLKATPTKKQKITTEQLQKSVEIIRNRVDALGVSEPEIRTQGTDQIAIELPGEKNPDRAVKVVGSTAQLRFYEFQENLVSNKAYRDPYALLKVNLTRAKKTTTEAVAKLDKATKQLKDAETASEKAKAKQAVAAAQYDETWFLFDSGHKQIAGPAISVEKLLDDPKYNNKLPKGYETLSVPIGEVMLHGSPDGVPIAIDEAPNPRYDRDKGIYLLLKDKPGLGGDQIRSATGESSNGGWVTSIIFTSKGGKLFGKVTEKIARRGAVRGYDQAFAIVLDDEIKSTPTISYKEYPRGIKGGNAQISGLDDREEAQDLALVLNTGALPVRFEVISKTTVSATLGGQSLRQGLLAGAAGLLVVMVYLLLFYRFLGLIADIALLVYAFIFYGIIVGLPITMTLPGIAGMILTIAVAADANIIIFERIREEYRAGRSVPASIASGYSKGLRTIIDANVVTIISAAVLFLVATGSVRGFALLLLLGTILSMFTAVAATFALLGLLGRLSIFRHPIIIGGSHKPQRFRIRWMSGRAFMLGFTAFIVLASLATVALKGLNLGVDFKSGTKFDVVLTQNASQEQVRKALIKVNPSYSNAQIQRTQEPAAGGRTRPSNEISYSIRVEKLSGSKGEGRTATERANDAQRIAENKVNEELDRQFGLKSPASVQTIGPSFGKQVLQGAIIAIFVGLLLEVLYIWMRFDLTYAIPVIIALAHDLIIAMGAYALTGREFKSSTVAALLTILGYSLYDTIIVFDRVRENIGILRKSPFSRIINTSLNEVLTRSINTTLVVLGPISALYFFGGETLKDFAYALLIGIFAGAYSSIIVASPILCVLKEREPAWARRKQVAARAGAGSEASPGAATGTATSETAPGIDAATTADTATQAERDEPLISPTSGRRDRRSRSQRRKS